MTLAEFDKQLANIDFNTGVNTLLLEDYLLACLALLKVYRNKKPSYELFLSIFDQARSGIKEEFDPSWAKIIKSEMDSELYGWEIITNELKILAADLIHTRKVRSQPGYIGRPMVFEWDTEGGVRFYNGTTISAILGYAATRFESEYTPRAFQEIKVNWEEFTYPIWIGISYE